MQRTPASTASTAATLRWFLALLCVLGFAAAKDARADQLKPLTVGWVEKVRLYPPDILLHAKLDTGADACSVHAEKVTSIKRGKERWVRFVLVNRYGQRNTLERRVHRRAKIKTKRGGSQTRPVVKFGICLGERYELVECNLVDRSHFTYPVLIGRNYLAGIASVNSSETYTLEPNCSGEPED